MLDIFGAYLEDYHFIKIIIPTNETYEKIKIVGYGLNTNLDIFKQEIYGNERHLYVSFEGYVSLHKDYQIIINEQLIYPLSLGKITRTKRFDIENATDCKLGYEYTNEYTVFRIWSPVAKEIYIEINQEKYALVYKEKGVWEVKIDGNLEYATYLYHIRVNKNFATTIDPYSKATTPNHKKSIVIDLTKTYQMKYDYFNQDNFTYNDAVIEEISIRDLTSKKDHGTFKDAIDSFEKDYGFGYLKNIGFTHFQFMPIFGFGGVDELNQDNYNWGYNPVSYMSVSNYLSSNPSNPYSGINELKELIDNLHKYGFGVCMDVVFNHVFDYLTYPFNVCVPGYAFVTDKRGFLTNSSGCGNDLNTLKKMVRRLIIDTISYFQQEFMIDGFRFDLMNLIDVDTLNMISCNVFTKNKCSLLYGEGWNIPMELPISMGGLSENFWQLPTYAFFNDYFRNAMKSNFNCTKKGFVLGEKFSNKLLFSALTGFCMKEERFNSPTCSINYIECHDNYTLYDTIKSLIPNIDEEELIDRMILALGVICFSEGIPFFHLGMEFGRSKCGNENSYNLSDDINGVNWDNLVKYGEVIEALKKMLELRKTYSFFRINSTAKLNSIVQNDNYDIMTLRYYNSEDNHEYSLIIKNDYQEEIKYFAPHSYLIFDGRSSSYKELQSFKLNRPGVYLFKK